MFLRSQLLLLFGFVFATALLARDAALAGRIVAKDQAPVPAAVVAVIQPATGWKRAVLSDSRGNFWIRRLPPGDYRVEAVKPGFESTAQPMVTLKAGENLSVNLHLVPASPSETTADLFTLRMLPVFWP